MERGMAVSGFPPSQGLRCHCEAVWPWRSPKLWETASTALLDDRSTDTTWIQANAKKVRNTAVPPAGKQ